MRDTNRPLVLKRQLKVAFRNRSRSFHPHLAVDADMKQQQRDTAYSMHEVEITAASDSLLTRSLQPFLMHCYLGRKARSSGTDHLSISYWWLV